MEMQGTEEHRNTGTQEHRSTGTQEHRSTGQVAMVSVVSTNEVLIIAQRCIQTVNYRDLRRKNHYLLAIA